MSNVLYVNNLEKQIAAKNQLIAELRQQLAEAHELIRLIFESTPPYIETKAPGKLRDVTALQERAIGNIRAAHGWALAIDDVSQLVSFLDGDGV